MSHEDCDIVLREVQDELAAASARAEKAEAELAATIARAKDDAHTALLRQRNAVLEAMAERDVARTAGIEAVRRAEALDRQLAALLANELETQYAARDTDGITRQVSPWAATRAGDWAPSFTLVARPVRACGDWEPADPPARADLPAGPDERAPLPDTRAYAGPWSPDGGAATTALNEAHREGP
jgi:hypothetical protein